MSRGPRGPVDLGFGPTVAERRPNPPLATTQTLDFQGFFLFVLVTFSYTLVTIGLYEIRNALLSSFQIFFIGI